MVKHISTQGDTAMAKGLTEHEAKRADQLTQQLSAFSSFQAMLDAPNYRPTIYLITPDHCRLAALYDKAQAARGDERRAYVGNTAPQVGDHIFFYGLGKRRHCTIRKVTATYVHTQYVTDVEARWAKKRGVKPHPFQRAIRREVLKVVRVAEGVNPAAWRDASADTEAC